MSSTGSILQEIATIGQYSAPGRGLTSSSCPQLTYEARFNLFVTKGEINPG